MHRGSCRGCGTSLQELLTKTNDTSDSAGQGAKTYVEAVKGTGLTRQKAEAATKIEALEEVLKAMKGEHLTSHRKAIADEIEILKQKTTDTRSLAKQVDSLETWIPREKKRIEKWEQELEESRKVLAQRKEDLCAEELRLTKLKKEIVEEGGKTANDDKQTVEQEAESHELIAKELGLRRQLAKKRDANGANLNATQIKKLQEEAEQIHGHLEKRRKKEEESKKGTEQAPGKDVEMKA